MFDFQRMIQWLRATNPGYLGIAALILLAFIIVAVSPAKAEGIAKKKAPAAAQPLVPALPAGAKSWTGCGVGVGANWTAGLVDYPGPVNMGAESSSISGRILCDMQIQGFVFGGFVDYGRFFGDLKTIGVEADLSVGGRAGVIMGGALLYGHMAWTQIDTTGGKADGWKWGPGVELKLPDQPVFLSFEYRRALYEAPLGSPFDVAANEYGATVIYKFGLGK